MNNYLIYGLDKGLINKKVEEIIKKIDVSLESIVKYNFDEVSFENILEDASTINLFGDKKIVVVNNATLFISGSEFDINKLTNYLNNYNDKTYLIFTIVLEKIDSKKKIIKLFNEKGQVINLNDQETNHNYIVKSLKDSGYEISVMDARYMISKIGNNNLLQINNELEKLMLYKLADKVITKKDIDTLIEENIDNNMFALVDAITNKDKTKMLDLYNKCLLESDPVMIINMVASKFILIFQVKRLLEEGYKDEQMAKLLETHPYPIKLARNSSYRYSEKELLDIILKFADLDKDIKLGKVDSKLGLELLLLEI